MMNKRALLSLAALMSVNGLSLIGSAAFAQTTPPARVRATIQAVDGNTLSLKARDGHELKVMLVDPVTVSGVGKTPITDIKPGSYIGCAAVPQADGTLKALEVTVFPASMAGTGEGSYPWDLGATSTMTNGTVGDLVVSAGRVMTVKYKGGGEKKITVPDDVPIVLIQPATRDDLKPGAQIIVVPTKAADGTLTASRVNVGLNGIAPPM